MRRLFLLLFSFLFIATFLQAQNKGEITTQVINKDLTQAPKKFNSRIINAAQSENSASAILSESFENAAFPPAGWSLLNPDGGTLG
jgi:hypothetical protein